MFGNSLQHVLLLGHLNVLEMASLKGRLKALEMASLKGSSLELRRWFLPASTAAANRDYKRLSYLDALGLWTYSGERILINCFH